MAMARAVNTPMRSNRAVGAGEASMASASFTSWGFSAEGISLSMMAMSSMPAKNAPTVAQLPARVPNWAASEAWALERISLMETYTMTPAEKPRETERNLRLVWRLRNATRLPMPVLRPANRVSKKAYNTLVSMERPPCPAILPVGSTPL